MGGNFAQNGLTGLVFRPAKTELSPRPWAEALAGAISHFEARH